MKWGVLALILIAIIGVAVSADSAITSKAKNYDGTVTQVNLGDGSFVFRLRDGTLVSVKNPIEVNRFLRINGVLDLTKGTLSEVSALSLKDPTGLDAVPAISLLDPGSGQVGADLKISGLGFSKKNNSISIGGIPYAIINLPSKDSKALTFKFPAAPCNQKLKINCLTTVLAPGNYNIIVSNENGTSNGVLFQVLPLPPLTITTETLPQVVGGTRYNTRIDAIGGAYSYAWRVSDGTLPPGLLFAQSACTDSPCKTAAIISGVPTTPGIYQFTITITSGQETISRQFSITVVQPLSSGY